MENFKIDNSGSLNKTEAESRLTPEQLAKRDAEFEEIDKAHEASLAALTQEKKDERNALAENVDRAWKKTQDERFHEAESDESIAEFTKLSQEHTEAQQALQNWDIKNLKF